MIKNYYLILNIKPNSSQKEIKKSFRKLAVFWHPDRNSNAIAIEKMQELNEAYEILFDSKKRIIYDKIYYGLFETPRNIISYEDDDIIDYNNQKEDFVRHENNIKKKYAKEINDLQNWIKNINFSISSFDKYLEKAINKVDKPIETFFYYLPYILLIIFIISFIIINI